MKKLTDKEKDYAKFKWEFLRRNPEYVADWKELQELMKTKYEGWVPTRRTIDVPRKEEASFCSKWKLISPLHPEYSYLDFCYSQREKGRLFRNLFSLATPPLKAIDGYILHDGSVYERLAMKRLPRDYSKKGLLQIEVNLNYSKTRLKNEFNLLVEEWKTIYEREIKDSIYKELCEIKGVKELKAKKTKEIENLFNEASEVKVETHEEIDTHIAKMSSYITSKDKYPEVINRYKKEIKKRRNKYRTKSHFENYDMYLQVWDLREKEKLTWNAIANKLFPKIENKIQTARNYYNAAIKIIKNGVDLYVN